MAQHFQDQLSSQARVVTFDRSYVHDWRHSSGGESVETSRQELLAVLKDLAPQEKVYLVAMNVSGSVSAGAPFAAVFSLRHCSIIGFQPCVLACAIQTKWRV